VGRPREFEPATALEQAVHLFWEKGYEETSFDDIVAATNVSRYGLYGAFGSKRDMFRKALGEYAQTVMGAYQAELRAPDASLPQIHDYFQTMLNFAENQAAGRGCLICNTAIEVAPHDEEIAGDVRRLFDEVTAVFRHALENAKTKREIAPKTNIDSCAVSLTGLIQSSALMVRVGYPMSTVRLNIDAALSRLDHR